MTALRVRPTPRTALPEDRPEEIRPDAAPGRGVLGEVRVEAGVTIVEVVVDGWRFELEVESADRAALRERATRGRSETTGTGDLEVRAIIPGRVVSVAVEDGATVTAGEPLLVLEAMKMQNDLRAPRDGTVRQLSVVPGARVELGDLLLVLE